MIVTAIEDHKRNTAKADYNECSCTPVMAFTSGGQFSDSISGEDLAE